MAVFCLLTSPCAQPTHQSTSITVVVLSLFASRHAQTNNTCTQTRLRGRVGFIRYNHIRRVTSGRRRHEKFVCVFGGQPKPPVSLKTVWPSGLRRWLQAPVRKGVGSNPTAVIQLIDLFPATSPSSTSPTAWTTLPEATAPSTKQRQGPEGFFGISDGETQTHLPAISSLLNISALTLLSGKV